MEEILAQKYYVTFRRERVIIEECHWWFDGETPDKAMSLGLRTTDWGMLRQHKVSERVGPTIAVGYELDKRS